MTREEIFELADFEVVPVEIPEWKTTLHVRTLSEGQKQTISHEIFVEKSNPAAGKTTGIANQIEMSVPRMAKLRVRTVELGTCNADGSRYFKDGDAGRLLTKNPRAIGRLFEAIEKLNAGTVEVQEDIAKNLEAVADDVSLSA